MAHTAPLTPLNESQRRPQRFAALFGVCALLTVSGCGFDMPDIPFMGDDDNATTRSSSIENDGPSTGNAAEIRPLTISPPKDVPRYNPKNMFGEVLRGEDERLDRLERSVQNMRNEFDSVTPSIKRLMAIEGDIQNLLVELKRLNDSPSAASPMVPAPTARQPQSQPRPAPTAAPAPKTATTTAPPPVIGGKASVYDVRVGEHPGKTRIVLDVNAKTGFSTDLDNGEKILIIELPDAGWSAATSKSFGRSPFLTSYKVEQGGNGSMLIFQLKREAKIAYKEDIGGANGGRRIVLDIAAP